jgi:hypothetical protein
MRTMDFRQVEVSDNVQRTIIEEPAGDFTLNRPQRYSGHGLARVEDRTITAESDFVSEAYQRHSEDNGRTWGEWEDNQGLYATQNGMEMLNYDFAYAYNPTNRQVLKLVLRRIFRYAHSDVYRKYWESGEFDWSDRCYIQVSKDDGHTWCQEFALDFEPGDSYCEDNWAYGTSLDTNRSYAGNVIEVRPDGSVLVPVSFRYSGSPDDDPSSDAEEGRPLGGLMCFLGRYDAATDTYSFTHGSQVSIEDTKSSRGLGEPNAVTLTSGKVLLEARGSNAISSAFGANMAPETPGFRWSAISEDDGQTFTTIRPLGYTDGSYPMSSASISKIIRSSKNGKAYWFGNLCAEIPRGNYPRSPLLMVEIDEESGQLVRDSTIVIDRREEEESTRIHLSNFTILDDRETGNIEVYLTRLGANAGTGSFWKNAAVKYTVTL